MKRFLLVIAYILIWTTPLQIGFVFWALWVTLSTDATILSLSNDIFVSEYLPFLYKLLKPLTYFVFPDGLAGFIWSLPVVIHASLKTVVSAWLGFWLLRRAKKMPSPNRES
jgi:hypothetical protein|tara:strand:- start:221 stop:553 length:333 start_codon:yes stop_codon:yes gene_type:complete